MRAALICCLVAICPVLGQDKKPEKITAENIEVGKVGTIERLVVEQAFEGGPIIANFGALRVLVSGYPGQVGKGKVLPKGQVWRVTQIIKVDTTGSGPTGCYALEPADRKKEKK